MRLCYDGGGRYLLHLWMKWSGAEERPYVRESELTDLTFRSTCLMQRRVCQRCGLTEERQA